MASKPPALLGRRGVAPAAGWLGATAEAARVAFPGVWVDPVVEAIGGYLREAEAVVLKEGTLQLVLGRSDVVHDWRQQMMCTVADGTTLGTVDLRCRRIIAEPVGGPRFLCDQGRWMTYLAECGRYRKEVSSGDAQGGIFLPVQDGYAMVVIGDEQFAGRPPIHTIHLPLQVEKFERPVSQPAAPLTGDVRYIPLAACWDVRPNCPRDRFLFLLVRVVDSPTHSLLRLKVEHGRRADGSLAQFLASPVSVVYGNILSGASYMEGIKDTGLLLLLTDDRLWTLDADDPLHPTQVYPVRAPAPKTPPRAIALFFASARPAFVLDREQRRALVEDGAGRVLAVPLPAHFFPVN